jgi:hypothetical protein
MEIEGRTYRFDWLKDKKDQAGEIIKLYSKKELFYIGDVEGTPGYHFYNTTLLLDKKEMTLIGCSEEIEKSKKNLEERLKIKLELIEE